jgi:hypothetical protein
MTAHTYLTGWMGRVELRFSESSDPWFVLCKTSPTQHKQKKKNLYFKKKKTRSKSQHAAQSKRRAVSPDSEFLLCHNSQEIHESEQYLKSYI